MRDNILNLTKLHSSTYSSIAGKIVPNLTAYGMAVVAISEVVLR